MASNLATHAQILVFQTTTNTTEQTQDYPELAGQTFVSGTPVQLSAGGFCQAWDGTTVVRGILGVSEQPAANLGTNGAGAPGAFGSIGFPGAAPTYGSVLNQSAAVNIPAGATFTTGNTTVAQAVTTTIFVAQVDSASGGAYTPGIANVGVQYGMTIGSDGATWYIDLDKTTVGTNTVLTVVGLYYDDLVQGSATTEIAGGRLLFKFNTAASQVGV